MCGLKVVELQYTMRTLAIAPADHGEALPAAYHRAMKFWFILGRPAFASLMIVFALMIVKPEFW